MASDKPQSTKEEIRAGIGDLSRIELRNNEILVGIWMRPTRTAGGIFLTAKTIDEDRWQGKVGLVLKKGPLAFVDDESHSFAGQSIEIDQWALYRTSDGMPVDIEGIHCRIIEDVHIKAVVTDPSIIY